MSDGWATLAQMLGMRDQQKQARRGRISSNVGNIAAMLYGRKEREAGQEFATAERLGAEAAASDEALKGREFEAGLSEREYGWREEEEKTRFGNESLLNEQQRDYQVKLNQQMIDANISLSQAQDTDAREREINRFEHELDLLAEKYEDLYADFAVPMIVRDPKTGEAHEVRNPAELDALLTHFLEQARQRAIELEARLRADPEGGKGQGLAIFEREFAKLQAARPEIWADAPGFYVTVDQKIYDELEQILNDNLMQLLRDGEIESLEDLQSIARMLSTYVKILEGGGGDVDTEPPRVPGTVGASGPLGLPLGGGLLSSKLQELAPAVERGFGGFAGELVERAFTPGRALSERMWPNLHPETSEIEREQTGMPEGVLAADLSHARRDEMEPWRQLQDLLGAFTTAQTPADQQQARDYQARLEEPGHIKLDELRAIKEFIERFQSVLPDNSSVGRQEDQLSYIRNTLRGV